ncbi:two-component system, NtrC family, response regulator [Desulfacinum hydrothermale DSM 13146]|uniref:Two-component system, NtrC family, response regulator n=1 Tax=Desulfacinum hydrothermale DSM 13146 TaxID=1121390 RepID=A0A1W1XT23_9BACT|nr:sigma-54 dependent transcriptional regulator [Desulfacinum hydrothermale]SMC27002.1 two-component system, NtrC family, response regulator [Desulfacinum hydrothermale DSM 13146]
MSPMRVLLIDDELYIRKLVEKELTAPHRRIVTADSAAVAKRRIAKETFDVVVVDIRLPDGDGIELLSFFRQTFPDVEVILITGYGTVESALKAMRLGAYDYITKPFDLERLELVLEKAFERVCLKRENRRLLHGHKDMGAPRLVGRSPAMLHITQLIKKVSPHPTSVLITGESGTGKEVVARNIHALSLRAKRPFVVMNCAELQKDLLRSELFGYIKGAFTGAMETRDGLIYLADGGTLFLDEIGDMPMELQGALLRVLETKKYRRVGDQRERHVDVRFLFATHRDLNAEVNAGRFHEALYHRLNVFDIHLPPLRERREEIPLLVEHLLGVLGQPGTSYTVPDETLAYLMSYHWPGNVRELRNVLERCLILSEDRVILPITLPSELVQVAHPSRSAAFSCQTLQEVERHHIQNTLAHFSGNKTEAARALGISRRTLYRKMKAYGLNGIENNLAQMPTHVTT